MMVETRTVAGFLSWLDKIVQVSWSLNRHIKIVHLMHAF